MTSAQRSSVEALKAEDSARSLDLQVSETRRLAPKEFNLIQEPGDVCEMIVAGAAGYGDPLDRDPTAVLADVANGTYDQDYAGEAFAVKFVVSADGALRVDHSATVAHRDHVRRTRLHHAAAAQRPAPQVTIIEMVLELSDHVTVGRDKRGDFYYCSSVVGRALAPLGESYKAACRRIDLDLTAVNPLIGDPREFIDDEMQFRLFVCPITGALIETEIARSVDVPLRDVTIDDIGLARLVEARRMLIETAQ
jgi:N-methylhydantoinase B